MDINAWGPIFIAFIAAVPGTIALILNARKEKRDADIRVQEAELNKTKDAREGLSSIIEPLQKEVARLQARVAELEQALIDKTNQIGLLMQEGIDKDVKLSTLQYKLQEVQTKMAALECSSSTTSKVDAKIAVEMNRSVAQKEEIAKQTQDEVDKIRNNSILNGSVSTKEN